MPFTEDLSVFFNDAEFATAVTLSGGDTVKVNFGRAVLDQLGVSATNPVAEAIASEVTAAHVGQTFSLGGTTYTITKRDPQDDGAIVLLQLQV